MRLDVVAKILRRLVWTGIAVWLFYWLMQITSCCSFHTPTGSMTPNIMPGDYGIVNKWKLGARIFDLRGAVEGRFVKVRRLPHYGELERGDVVVFNYPLLGKDSVGINMYTYYCKRVIALSGDTVEIRNCRYRVSGLKESLGYVPAQIALEQWLRTLDNPEEHICYYTWPYDSVMGWTVKEFGPLLVPKKGSKIAMTREATLLYGRYIAWENQTRALPQWRDGRAWFQGRELPEYTFTENYYFVAGDRVSNSADSRYWGLLPEPMIVGTTSLIWDSVDPETDTRRWDRVLTWLPKLQKL